MQKSQNLIYLLSGITCAGKRMLGNDAIKHLRSLGISINTTVSWTSRPQRPDEVHGQDYWFTTTERFREMIAAGEFLEYMDVHNNGKFYGTPKSEIDQKLQQGNVLVEVDVKGALEILRAYRKEHEQGHLVDIFVDVTSMDEVRRRLAARDGGTTDSIEERLKNAPKEKEIGRRFGHILMNDGTAEAAKRVMRKILTEAYFKFNCPGVI